MGSSSSLCFTIVIATFCFAHSTVSIPYRDGPVDLPDNISLRTSKKLRHRPKPVKEEQPLPPALGHVLEKEIKGSDKNLNSVKELLREDLENGIIDRAQIGEVQRIVSSLPEWVASLPKVLLGARSFLFNTLMTLTKLGLSSIFNTEVFRDVFCTQSSSETEKIVCMTQTINNISELINTGAEVLSLNYRVLSGGRIAKEALTTLNTLSANPRNRQLMKLLGCTVVLYITLMRENVTDETKWMAGSIMTELTTLPVVSNVSDISSGGFGHTNVVLPRPTRVNKADYNIAKLMAGANEKRLIMSLA